MIMAISKSSSSFPITKAEAKAKTPKPSKSAKPSLSTEYVQDSDVSDEKIERKPKRNHSEKSKQSAKVNPKPLKNVKASSPSPVKLETGRNGTTRNKLPHPPVEDESDEDKTTSSSQDSTPTPTRQTSVSSRHIQTKPIRPPNDTNPVKQPVPPNSDRVKKSSANHTSESNESESDNGNQSESENSEQSSSESFERSQHRQNEPSMQLLRPYKPPAGFEDTTISILPTSKILEIFAPKNLVGKQIWHITAPMSVPVTSIKQISTQSLRNGSSILSYEDAEYGLSSESRTEQASNHALILPSTQHNEYRLSRIPITKTIHLQQLVKLPNRAHEISSSSLSTGLKPRTHVGAPRQQPKGLRMRYHPFGTSQDSFSDSDASTTAEPKAPEFRFPTSAGSGLHKKKRRLSAMEMDDQRTEDSPIKKRKQKSRPEDRGLQRDTSQDINDHGNGETTAEARTPGVRRIGSVLNREKRKKRKGNEKGQDQMDMNQSAQSILPPDLLKEAEQIIPQEVVNLDEGVNIISTDRDPREQKKRRKEAKSSTTSIDKSAKRDAKALHGQLKNQSREQSISFQRSEQSSPSKPDLGQESQARKHLSSPSTPRQETKQEKAKRREEKRSHKAKLGLE